MNSKPTDLAGDRPVRHPNEDRLGYDPFARHLSKAISSSSGREGLVVALYGAWGSGKTSLLNFVEHHLRSAPEDESPQIIHFNPWWFTGDEDLAKRFFEQVIASLDAQGQETKEIKTALRALASHVSSFELPWYVKASASIFHRCLGSAPPTVHALRSSLERLLQRQQRRILVIIDDVDRLTPPEIRDLFRVAKAIADLPQMTYLLAFDKNIVSAALGEIHNSNGTSYLEKIVQVPFELPAPDRAALQDIFIEKVNQLLGEMDDGVFDPRYWWNVYYDGIGPLLGTPRDVIRLTNLLSVTYPAVCGEVNPVDFIAIETLKVFEPTVYHAILARPDAFTCFTATTPFRRKDDEQEFHDAYIANVSEANRDHVRAMLQRIFPRLQAVWEKTYHGMDWLPRWRKNRRACVADLLPIYLRLNLPPGTVSSVDLDQALAATSSREQFAALLRELSHTASQHGSKARQILVRLEDFTESDIPDSSISPAVLALFDVADELNRSEPDQPGMLSFGMNIQVRRILLQLLRRLPATQQISILSDAIRSAAGLGTIIDEVVALAREHGKCEGETSAEPRLPLEQVEQLEALGRQRVESDAAAGTLIDSVDLPWVLHAWRFWDEQACRTWISEHLHQRRFVVNFLEQALRAGYSQSLEDRITQKRYMISLDFISPLFDPASIARNAEEALEDHTSVNERQRVALQTFLRALENDKTATAQREEPT